MASNHLPFYFFNGFVMSAAADASSLTIRVPCIMSFLLCRNLKIGPLEPYIFYFLLLYSAYAMASVL